MNKIKVATETGLALPGGGQRVCFLLLWLLESPPPISQANQALCQDVVHLLQEHCNAINLIPKIQANPLDFMPRTTKTDLMCLPSLCVCLCVDVSASACVYGG